MSLISARSENQSVSEFFCEKIQNPGGSSLTKVLTQDCLSLPYNNAFKVTGGPENKLSIIYRLTHLLCIKHGNFYFMGFTFLLFYWVYFFFIEINI